MSDGTDVATAEPAAIEPAAGALVPAGEHALAVSGHDHPGPRQYVLIAIVLVTLTGIEVAVSYLDTKHTNIVIIVLAVMASLKFFLVAAWYMHMKQDSALFRRMFVAGMILAAVVYGVMLLFFSSTVLKS